ncbi:retrovirus-related pol polyprotein from transposon TNT 1-94 [Tanacetum coccineum]
MRLIQSLASKESVRNLPKLKFDQHFCDACKIGKQVHVSHKAKKIVSTTRCLELLHMNLFGPSSVQSYGGNRYSLVIVDDYSRKPTLDYFRVYGSKCFILITKDYLTKFDPKSYEGVFLDITLGGYVDLDEEEAIKVTEKKNLENDIEDETLEIDEIVNIKESRNHPLENVIGNLNQRTLRSQAQNQCNFFCFISTIEPKNVNEALTDDSWIVAMQEELNQFIANDVWELVPQPRNMTIIGTNFINEEVYVAQPPGFIDFEKLDHVYKLKKALYGLKQAPKAWYDRLKAFLIKHEYKMGMVDNTLFTKKRSSNLIIVQIYVDDIIFGLTCQDMCDEFAKIMHDEFEMSMMEMLKKFGLEESKPMKTPMSSDTKLTKDEECESVDSTKYRGMIGSLLYLTASRPDIMFSVCLCARFQEAPKTSHLEAVKAYSPASIKARHTE